MATAVEVNNPGTTQELQKEQPVKGPQLQNSKPEDAEHLSHAKVSAKKADAGSDKSSSEKGDAQASNPKPNAKGVDTEKQGQTGKDAKDGPVAKIFDNKNFVEAPLPKTNPWTKNVTAAPVPAASLKLEATAPVVSKTVSKPKAAPVVQNAVPSSGE